MLKENTVMMIFLIFQDFEAYFYTKSLKKLYKSVTIKSKGGNRLLKKCKWCKKPFTSNNPIKVYCTRKCYQEHFETIYKKKESDTRSCVVCGNKFMTTHQYKKYCSKNCYRKGQQCNTQK